MRLNSAEARPVSGYVVLYKKALPVIAVHIILKRQSGTHYSGIIVCFLFKIKSWTGKARANNSQESHISVDIKQETSLYLIPIRFLTNGFWDTIYPINFGLLHIPLGSQVAICILRAEWVSVMEK